MTDYDGKTVVITGATSGLGLAVSTRFAQLGADTLLVCRTEQSGERAARVIESAAPGASVRPMLCDLASMASIEEFIADLKAQHASIDLLFNNAAVMKRDRTLTHDGLEMMFQVNYLAPVILMTSLLDQLRSSTTHLVIGIARPSRKERVDFDDLQFAKHYGIYRSFFQTKLDLTLASIELAHRPEAHGVSIHLADPGAFKSDLLREARWPAGWIKNAFSRPVDTAADNIVFVASSDQARSGTGKVFNKHHETPLASYWKDTHVRARLWSATEAMIETANSH